jgi:Acetyltransferase (GNAT) domain
VSKHSLLSEWDSYLERFPPELKDIYFTERYVRLYETNSSRAEAYLFEDGDDIFLMPFLRRPVVLLGPGKYDFETAYGYGGPISTTEDPGFVGAACAAFEEAASNSGLIAGFIRFHPLLQNAGLVSGFWPVIYDRPTQAIDLTPSEQEMLQRMHQKHRNKLSRANAAGLSFEVDTGFHRMDDMASVYLSTMTRLEAAPEYFFGPSYFDSIRRNLAGNGFIALVLCRETVAAAGLFLRMAGYGHAHLAASDPEFLQLGPNNLLFFGAALALKQMGAHVLHLGGGRTSSLDDSLLRFKRRFGTIDLGFYRGQLVLDQEAYTAACAAWDDGPGQCEALGRYRDYTLRYQYLREVDGTVAGERHE